MAVYTSKESRCIEIVKASISPLGHKSEILLEIAPNAKLENAQTMAQKQPKSTKAK